SAWGWFQDLTERLTGAGPLLREFRLPAFDLDLVPWLKDARQPSDFTIHSRVIVTYGEPDPLLTFAPVEAILEVESGSGPSAVQYRRSVPPYGDAFHVAAARLRGVLRVATA